ncbi:MAG TPA: COQ9 family protein [Patescibacteria group bacterium]|nr:COQ9 family protein [Patescibacteria group bacterium]
MTPPVHDMRDIRDQLVVAALAHVPFDGWAERSLREAAKDLGFDASMGERAFPGGAVEAAIHFADLADRRLTADAAAADLRAMPVGKRIAWLVRRRLEPWTEQREVIRRAITLLSLPNHAADAVRATWRTVDALWYAAGDVSADFSYYTKRATLAAIYMATLLYWLEDKSDDFIETWAFLDRRLADARALPKWGQQVKQGLSRLPNPLALAGMTLTGRKRFGIRA